MTFLGKINIVLLGATITIVSFITPYLNQLSAIERKVQIKVNDQFILADVAKTATALERGLAGRSGLAINEGLLLFFAEADRHGIWMKDVQFPIDVVWIHGNRVVGFTENIQPQAGARDIELTTYYPPEPVDKVLELRAGRVRLFQAAVGDEVRMRLIVPKK